MDLILEPVIDLAIWAGSSATCSHVVRGGFTGDISTKSVTSEGISTDPISFSFYHVWSIIATAISKQATYFLDRC
jgi:hypothetical protein